MDRFIVGKYYIARNSRMENIGVYQCTRRTDSFVFFVKEHGWTEIRRKCKKDTHEEYVELDKGHPTRVRGYWTGRKFIYAGEW